MMTSKVNGNKTGISTPVDLNYILSLGYAIVGRQDHDVL